MYEIFFLFSLVSFFIDNERIYFNNSLISKNWKRSLEINFTRSEKFFRLNWNRTLGQQIGNLTF